MKIIIDPGHGGKDSGGGCNDLWLEKNKVLQISLYQYNRLKELGIDVELTRSTDIYLSPAERAKKVRDSKSTICISNHINAFNGVAKGAETIHSIHSDGKFANILLDELVQAGATRRRVFFRESEKKKGTDYYFMHYDTGNVQTIIIEYGFADNKEDAEKIDRNWKEYAEAVVRGICKYIGVEYKPLLEEVGNLKKWQRDQGENAIRSLSQKKIIESADYWIKLLNGDSIPDWALWSVLDKITK